MIPKLHFISRGISATEHLENIQKACSSGAELVQLDLEHISEKDHLKLAQEVLKITAHFQTRLVIKTYYKIAHKIKADGTYLDRNDTCPTLARKGLYDWQTIGAAANTLEDCHSLIAKDIDYIGLGPFKISEDQKNHPVALGFNGYTAIIEILTTETPLIGFGGITTADVLGILDTGVSGIMVTKAITADFNSIKTFNELLGASSTDEMRHTFI
ncbi:thiamine phosphate synthase [Nonlabens sp.]|uniref:thiamine phosphate synthase n=1 Tax=Nonlabens sp. TaxID=1888209 RepID=UPI0025D5D079|nr:thiamine phosphate synthase [Nonlabens sp.]